jgi:CheY-like chemotaxis protein
MRQPYRKVLDTPGEKSQAAVAKETAQQRGQNPGVLVVDDDTLMRIMLRTGLERHGFQVWLAASGREALALYRQHREATAVVLLDVRMPGLDGPQTLEALHCLDPEVVACFMSADPGGYQPDELRERGAKYVFVKPFRLDDLAKTLLLLAHGVPTSLVPSCKA